MGHTGRRLLFAVIAAVASGGAVVAQEMNVALTLATKARTVAQYARVHSALMKLDPVEQHDTFLRLKDVNENAYLFVVQTVLAAEGFAGPIDGQLTRGSISALNSYCAAAAMQTVCTRGPMDPRSAQVLAGAFFSTRTKPVQPPAPASLPANPIAPAPATVAASKPQPAMKLALPHDNSLVRRALAAHGELIGTETGSGVQVTFEGKRTLYRVSFKDVQPGVAYALNFRGRIVEQSVRSQKLVMDIGDSQETLDIHTQLRPRQWSSVTVHLSTDQDAEPWIDLQLRSPGSLVLDLADFALSPLE